MSKEAYLPCFKCGRILQNAFVECDNQPSEGTEFRTQGHYGSTFWDSFNCEDLVLNICDQCLREHSNRLGQQKVSLPIRCGRLTGFGEVRVDRPLVPYTGNEDRDFVSVDVEDLGNSEAVGVTHDPSRVQWVSDIEELKRSIIQSECESEWHKERSRPVVVRECPACGAEDR